MKLSLSVAMCTGARNGGIRLKSGAVGINSSAACRCSHKTRLSSNCPRKCSGRRVSHLATANASLKGGTGGCSASNNVIVRRLIVPSLGRNGTVPLIVHVRTTANIDDALAFYR